MHTQSKGPLVASSLQPMTAPLPLHPVVKVQTEVHYSALYPSRSLALTTNNISSRPPAPEPGERPSPHRLE